MQKNNIKVLFIIPSFIKVIYENTKIKVGRINSPVLSIASLASVLIKNNYKVNILDLNLFIDMKKIIFEEIKLNKPQFVGITVTTPLFNQMVEITKLIKNIDKSIKIIIGGPHVSSLPEESLANSLADIAVIGEGEETIIDIIEHKNLEDIYGIAYKYQDKIILNKRRKLIENLNNLPFPAWNLYNLKKYRISKLMARKSPAGWIETSRGCPFNCVYCNKSVFGREFRVKSPSRVVDEIEYMLKMGFKEIHIADDMFTTDIIRVKKICDEIISRKLRFPWSTVTGIRVDRGDEEMFKKMAAAGCYRIYLGIESGNQDILNKINKRITLEQVKNTINLVKKTGMEICGFFMFALPGETEKTMQDTIDFACSLDLDLAKATITTPLPGTPLFYQLQKENRIKTNDWSKYNLYIPANKIYEHQNLKWEVIEKYYNKFYRKFYFRPKYILKTFYKSIKNKTFFHYILYLFKTKW